MNVRLQNHMAEVTAITPVRRIGTVDDVREVGVHQELLRQRGIYYKLYQLQYKEQTRELSETTSD